MAPRGIVAFRQLQRSQQRQQALGPAQRLRRKSKCSDVQLTLRGDVLSPSKKEIKLPTIATPVQKTSLCSMYGAPRKRDRSQLAVVAAGRPQPADATGGPHAGAVGHWRHGGQQRPPPELAFTGGLITAVNNFIDSDVTRAFEAAVASVRVRLQPQSQGSQDPSRLLSSAPRLPSQPTSATSTSATWCDASNLMD